MTTTIITALVLWTVFGFFVLFNLGNQYNLKKITGKHMLLMGPVLMAGLITIGLLSLGLEKAMDWANK